MRKVSFFCFRLCKILLCFTKLPALKEKNFDKNSLEQEKNEGNAFSLFICFDLFIFCFVSSKCLIELRRKAAPGFHFCCFDESKFVIVITQAKTNEKQCRQAMNNIWEF